MGSVSPGQFIVPAAQRAGGCEYFHGHPGNSLVDQLAFKDLFTVAYERVLNCRREPADQTADASGQLVMEDLGSTNGTSVNGTPTARAVLRPSDVLAIGRVSFTVNED